MLQIHQPPTGPIMKIQIQEVAYHRNGMMGEGFHAVRFYPYRKPGEPMLAMVFPGRGRCAVIRLDLIETVGVAFGENSWRGDDYEPALRAAIRAYEKERGLRVVRARAA